MPEEKRKKEPKKVERIRLKEGVIFRVLEGEAAVVKPEDGTLIILNETGTFILRHLKKGITKEALVKKIVSEYDTTEREAERDLNSFLRSLKKNGLVEF